MKNKEIAIKIIKKKNVEYMGMYYFGFREDYNANINRRLGQKKLTKREWNILFDYFNL